MIKRRCGSMGLGIYYPGHAKIVKDGEEITGKEEGTVPFHFLGYIYVKSQLEQLKRQ
jgi:hypothetical protein